MYNYGYTLCTGGEIVYMKNFSFSFGTTSLLIIIINIINTFSGYPDNNILFISNPLLRFLANHNILKTSGVTYYLFNKSDVFLSYAIHFISFILLGALLDFISNIDNKMTITKNFIV